MPESPKPDEYAGLLEQYLRVCNKVLQQNGDRFPYNQIWKAGEEALSGRTIEFAVVDDEPKAQCRVTLSKNRIRSEADLAVEEHPPVMRLSASYLQQVVSDPDKYIENPSLIDWGWLSPRQ